MLAVFYGTDRKAVRDAGKAYTDNVGVPVTVVDESSFFVGQIASSIGAASLFGGAECFLLDTPPSDEDFESEVMGSLAEMAASENVFVVLEGQLLADAKKKYTKHATTVEEYTAQKEERFNVFQIAEAFAKKDKKQMWVLLQQARALGIRDEETIGIIWWQLKSLRLAKVTRSAEEAGMKDYPYKKTSQALRNFKDGEVEALSSSLLGLYHEGHQGKKEIEVSLEQWVLTI
jgi:DNA polymerase III delta subunit